MKQIHVFRKYKKGLLQDYSIYESVNHKTGNKVYQLLRHGSEWTDDAFGEVAISLEDTGDGYKLSDKLGKELGYDVAAELYILLRYLDVSEKRERPETGGLFSGEIQIIEQCKSINF